MHCDLDRSEAKWRDLRLARGAKRLTGNLQIRVPQLRALSALRWAFATTLFLTPTLPIHPQGCTQCLDSTRATPPQLQTAYRHAIYLLAGTATTLFLTGALLLRRPR